MALYIIATPIGNLKDLTTRAKEIFSKLGFLVCEDTRKTGLLLKASTSTSTGNMQRPELIALNSFNESMQTPKILNLLNQGKDVGLVSNAGTPLISDPGFKLVRYAIEQEIKVIPIPGPSAIIAALSASGMPPDKFTFLGFLPKKEGELTALLQKCQENPLNTTYIAFVSPYKLLQVLNLFNTCFKDTNLCIANDITKIHESIETKRVGDWVKIFEVKAPKGEYTILFRCPSSNSIGQKLVI